METQVNKKKRLLQLFNVDALYSNLSIEHEPNNHSHHINKNKLKNSNAQRNIEFHKKIVSSYNQKKNPDNDSTPMGQTSLESLPLDFFYKKNG